MQSIPNVPVKCSKSLGLPVPPWTRMYVYYTLPAATPVKKALILHAAMHGKVTSFACQWKNLVESAQGEEDMVKAAPLY